MRLNILSPLLLGVATLSLMACATTTSTTGSSGTSPYDAKINAAIERAADQASRDGSPAGSLALMEKLYKRDPKNADNALKFARALRASGDEQKAAMVLEPFATRPDASGDTLTEMATLRLNAGKYGLAETTARRAVTKDPNAYKAYQILGISLDAQNKYKEGESAFRSALDLWQGDPIPVMNNLALNLTNQERLPEALEIMERAKVAAPNRVEVERNLRIIRTLNESASGRPAPKPTDKPAVKPVAMNAAKVEPSAGADDAPLITSDKSATGPQQPALKAKAAPTVEIKATPAAKVPAAAMPSTTYNKAVTKEPLKAE